MSFLHSTLRHFRKNKVQLSIALVGLVLGWSCFISISIYLQKELTFDQFHEKSDRIFRVTHNEKAGEIPGTRHLATVGPPMGPGLKETYPQVEEFVRLRQSSDWIVRFGERQHYENSVWYADPSFFKIFSFRLSEGNQFHALDLPNSVVITQEMALKYFGQIHVLGKTLTMNQTEWTVTGVLEPIPSNSHITFDFLLPFQSFHVPYGYPVTLESWGWISFHTYVLLKDSQDAFALQKQLPELVKQHWEEERAKKFRLELQPLHDIYLGEVNQNQMVSGNATYLSVLAIAGLMIMIVASFNFANLFTVIAISRAKEVGVNKLLGATKGHLARKLNVEAVILVVTSLLISLSMLPLWIEFLPWPAPLSQLTSAAYLKGILFLFAVSVFIGGVAGFYPARLLVQYDFQKLLKGSFKVGKTGIVLRRGMLLFQFIVSITLLCSVLIIFSQMEYLRRKDLGYVKDELLLLHVPGEELATKFQPLKNKLLENPAVTNVSIGGGRMDGDTGNVPIYTENTSETGEAMSIDAVTFDFFKTIGTNLIAGREFVPTHPADTLNGVIINVSAAKELGWTPDTALGKKIRIGDIVLHGEVIGVVPDFNFGSLHNTIKPLVISYPRTRLQDVYVRFNGKDLSKIVSSVSKDWKVVLPHLPFDYAFLNDHLAELYRNDQEFSNIFQFFAIIAICIACLGLYGLISQDVLYRVKEIGIRKVLGANTLGLTSLLLKQFLILIVCANLVAWPISFYIMNHWLSEFSYRTAISWFVFPVASAVVFLLCFLSVSVLSIKAAMANPTKSLRAE
jgi:putative ABC transport system permease protein